ncbi:spore cortex-lytic enzyme-like [Saccostrea echinata]|uniref:spore cortex-lytic enzyme-like n=1 Tax=Saccostrea echinata TaxID=191078 RepID=UPI002A83437C|nr:spore cortex-lytic enzyme-like [Saccostrea echinata]
MLRYAIIGLVLSVWTTFGQICTDANIKTVARIVFGEARGEPMRGQLAVAYTIVNRKNHQAYPNTINDVVYQKRTNGREYQYDTLHMTAHTQAWNDAQRRNTQEYKNAIKASGDALCNRQRDPTRCATDYCAFDPCRSTRSNKWWRATNKLKIGNHYFVCRVAASG